MQKSDDTYTYIKKRMDFGRQPMFCEAPVVLLDSILPDKQQQKLYCCRNPVHNSTQTIENFSEHEINTRRVRIRDHGMKHVEGGWPKEINYDDEESTTRHRRKFERDEEYAETVIRTYPKLNRYTDQNNAIEMYNLYFKGMKPMEPVETSSVRISNVFVDRDQRPVSSISWTHEEDSKVAVSYCNKRYPAVGPPNKNTMCHIWDIENPNEPFADFLPPSPCWQVVCVPKSPNIIVGGLGDGRVSLFDVRSKIEPSALSPMHLAHRESVTAVAFIHSRLNIEFFSGSTDGKCMWWDLRNLSLPTDSLIMSLQIPHQGEISMSNAEGVSSLQYDRSFPTKFLCGTVTGLVINVNRKGKSHQEIMSSVFKVHNGPVKSVKSVHRSPCTSKVFITCGDWTVHLWSDDVQIAPIVTGTAHRHQITDVVWAPNRVSSYMSVCADGKFRYWDLLRKYREPTYTLPVSKFQLLKITPHIGGQLVAVGDIKGSVNILSLSDNMVNSADKDKQRMLQCLDREGRREHILDSRLKEIKLMKLKGASKTALDSTTCLLDTDAIIKSTEDEYKKIVNEEFRRTGITPHRSEGKPRLRGR